MLFNVTLFVRNFMQSFVFSVFPAPDSPLITIAWFLSISNSDRYASAAIAKGDGGRFRMASEPLFLVFSMISE